MIKRECDVETPRDFLRYYLHGFLGFPRPDLGVIFPFTPVNADDRVVLGRILQKDGEKYSYAEAAHQWPLFRELVHFGRPNVGMVHDGPSVVYLSYRSERNSARGLRLDRAVFHDFNNWYLRKQPGRVPPNTNSRHDLVWESFNPNYSSVSAAWQRLNDGKTTGVPLSLHYGAYTVPDGRFPLLAYKRWTIGHLTGPETVSIHRKFHEYQPDIQRRLKVGVTLL